MNPLTRWARCLALPLAFAMGHATAADPAPPEAQVLTFLQQNPDFLNRHPELLDAARRAAALEQRLKARAQVERALQASAPLLRSPLLARAGDAPARLRIIEFMDYRCAPCRASSAALARVLASDPALSLVVLPYPIFGDESQFAARVAFAAQQQGRFWPMHERLWDTPLIDRRSALRLAQALQLDEQRFLTDVASPQWPALQSQIGKLAQALAVGGLPALVVGDLMLVGGVDEPLLRHTIATARCLSRGARQEDCGAK